MTGIKCYAGSVGVNHRSICLEMLYGYQISSEDFMTRELCIAGVGSHTRVSRGLTEVKLPRNDLWPLNLVRIASDQSVMHWLNKIKCHKRVILDQEVVNSKKNTNYTNGQ